MLIGPRIRSHLRRDSHRILRQTQTRSRNKRPSPSPHVNDKGSPRRTYIAVSTPAWSHSKTRTCVRSTAGATSPRAGAAQARAGLRRQRRAGLRAKRHSSATSTSSSSQSVRRQLSRSSTLRHSQRRALSGWLRSAKALSVRGNVLRSNLRTSKRSRSGWPILTLRLPRLRRFVVVIVRRNPPPLILTSPHTARSAVGAWT